MYKYTQIVRGLKRNFSANVNLIQLREKIEVILQGKYSLEMGWTYGSDQEWYGVAALRYRIHEEEPVSGLYVAVRLHGNPTDYCRELLKMFYPLKVSEEDVMEDIRAAVERGPQRRQLL